eukprot:g18109.t1
MVAELPIDNFREEIMRQVMCQPLTVIMGETGCGKSSRVPPMLLDGWERLKVQSPDLLPDQPFIVVTQPRRIAAISLARRVAAERQEPLGRSVGYVIGQDRHQTHSTRILYCTVGWLLQKLVHDPAFCHRVTHFVLDEIHERGIDSDVLNVLLKKALHSRWLQCHSSSRADRSAVPPAVPSRCPRLVVMSATFNTELFASYFCFPRHPVPPAIAVHVRKFPVTIYHCEELLQYPLFRQHRQLGLPDPPANQGLLDRLARDLDQPDPPNSAAANLHAMFLWMLRAIALETALTSPAAPQPPGPLQTADPAAASPPTAAAGAAGAPAAGTGVLVFVAGLAEIDELSHLLDEAADRDAPSHRRRPGHLHHGLPGLSNSSLLSETVDLFVLHSHIEQDTQLKVFEPVPPGRTRLILSTNIAESSVTLPHIKYIFDYGFHKQVEYDPRFRADVLESRRISQASAKQRAGRAGRVCPGVVFRFYSRAQFTHSLEKYDRPEIARASLANTLLRLKILLDKEDAAGPAEDNAAVSWAGLESPEALLKESIEPPSLDKINSAYHELLRVGALEEENKACKLQLPQSAQRPPRPSQPQQLQQQKTKQKKQQGKQGAEDESDSSGEEWALVEELRQDVVANREFEEEEVVEWSGGANESLVSTTGWSSQQQTTQQSPQQPSATTGLYADHPQWGVPAEEARESNGDRSHAKAVGPTRLTPLGRFFAQIPFDFDCSKLVALGLLAGPSFLPLVVLLATAVSAKPVFVLPHPRAAPDARSHCQMARQAALGRRHFQTHALLSDLLSIVPLVHEYCALRLAFPGGGGPPALHAVFRWSSQYGVHAKRLQSLLATTAEVTHRLCALLPGRYVRGLRQLLQAIGRFGSGRHASSAPTTRPATTGRRHEHKAAEKLVEEADAPLPPVTKQTLAELLALTPGRTVVLKCLLALAFHANVLQAEVPFLAGEREHNKLAGVEADRALELAEVPNWLLDLPVPPEAGHLPDGLPHRPIGNGGAQDREAAEEGRVLLHTAELKLFQQGVEKVAAPGRAVRYGIGQSNKQAFVRSSKKAAQGEEKGNKQEVTWSVALLFKERPSYLARYEVEVDQAWADVQKLKPKSAKAGDAAKKGTKGGPKAQAKVEQAWKELGAAQEAWRTFLEEEEEAQRRYLGQRRMAHGKHGKGARRGPANWKTQEREHQARLRAAQKKQVKLSNRLKGATDFLEKALKTVGSTLPPELSAATALATARQPGQAAGGQSRPSGQPGEKYTFCLQLPPKELEAMYKCAYRGALELTAPAPPPAGVLPLQQSQTANAALVGELAVAGGEVSRTVRVTLKPCGKQLKWKRPNYPKVNVKVDSHSTLELLSGALVPSRLLQPPPSPPPPFPSANNSPSALSGAGFPAVSSLLEPSSSGEATSNSVPIFQACLSSEEVRSGMRERDGEQQAEAKTNGLERRANHRHTSSSKTATCFPSLPTSARAGRCALYGRNGWSAVKALAEVGRAPFGLVYAVASRLTQTQHTTFAEQLSFLPTGPHGLASSLILLLAAPGSPATAPPAHQAAPAAPPAENAYNLDVLLQTLQNEQSAGKGKPASKQQKSGDKANKGKNNNASEEDKLTAMDLPKMQRDDASGAVIGVCFGGEVWLDLWPAVPAALLPAVADLRARLSRGLTDFDLRAPRALPEGALLALFLGDDQEEEEKEEEEEPWPVKPVYGVRAAPGRAGHNMPQNAGRFPYKNRNNAALRQQAHAHHHATAHMAPQVAQMQRHLIEQQAHWYEGGPADSAMAQPLFYQPAQQAMPDALPLAYAVPTAVPQTYQPQQQQSFSKQQQQPDARGRGAHRTQNTHNTHTTSTGHMFRMESAAQAGHDTLRYGGEVYTAEPASGRHLHQFAAASGGGAPTAYHCPQDLGGCGEMFGSWEQCLQHLHTTHHLQLGGTRLKPAALRARCSMSLTQRPRYSNNELGYKEMGYNSNNNELGYQQHEQQQQQQQLGVGVVARNPVSSAANGGGLAQSFPAPAALFCQACSALVSPAEWAAHLSDPVHVQAAANSSARAAAAASQQQPQHVQSRAHQAKARSVNTPQGGRAAADASWTGYSNNPHNPAQAVSLSGELAAQPMFCALCQSWAPSQQHWQAHLRGDKHKQIQPGVQCGAVVQAKASSLVT